MSVKIDKKLDLKQFLTIASIYTLDQDSEKEVVPVIE